MITFQGGSFRDPQARVVQVAGETYRLLSARALEEWRALSASPLLSDLVADGSLVRSEELDFAAAPPSLRSLATGNWAGLLRHETVPFISYPYEWSFGMLKDAALLQLHLLRTALEVGFTMKDATPFNIQWRGSQPVFIDLTSFERLQDGEPWFGYRQFCSLFLNPLMLQAYRNVPFHPWLRGSLGGIEPEHLLPLLRLRDLCRGDVFLHVFLHAKLQRRLGKSRTDYVGRTRSAGFSKELISANLRRLQRAVERLEWLPATSEWSEYGVEHSYSTPDLEAKISFVSAAIAGRRRRCVWDLGANTGRFASLAADHADRVIAIDADHLCLDRLHRRLKANGNTKIHPLVIDLSQPSPSLGWRGRERMSLAERSDADFLLSLALLHHMVIGNNIPVAEMVDWLRTFGCEVVLEVPHREDPMTAKLLMNKKEKHDEYTLETIEARLRERFAFRERLQLPSGKRTLYHLEPI